MEYKGYKITKNEFNYYEGVSIDDCDAPVLWAKTKEELKTEIDENR